MTAVAPDQRQRVLVIASGITAQASDAAAVIRNATPLLAWLQDAPDQADLDLRLGALDQMFENLEPGAAGMEALAVAAAAGTTAVPFLEDAQGFVTSAEMLYLVTIADSADADFSGADPDDITDPAARREQHPPSRRAAADALEQPARHNATDDDVPRRPGEGASCCPRCGALLVRDYAGQWWAPIGGDCAHTAPPDTGSEPG